MLWLDGKKGADFEEEIGKPEREMKGYVEVTYTNSKAKENAKILSDLPLININNEYSSGTEVYDNDKVGTNYASLEKDYFKLDGSFILPNNKLSENPGLGLMSENTFEDETDIKFEPIKISTSWGNTAPADGLTLYFKNNIPTDLEIFINSNDGTGPTGQQTFYTKDMSISENGIVNLNFSPRKLNFARIFIKGVTNPEWRIRMSEIDFGVSYLYEGQDLISFNTVEMVDRFADSMPTNECEVVVGNIDKKFNYENPSGITKYLNDGVEIKPFVGIKTPRSGIVYCPKGVYWLKEWNANKTEATLKGQDIFCKLQTLDYEKNQNQDREIGLYLSDKAKVWGVDIVNYHNDPSLGINEYVDDVYAKLTPKITSLQKMSLVCGGIFNANRFGGLKYFDDNYETLPTGTMKQIDFRTMRDFPKITATNPISKIECDGYLFNTDTAGINKEVFYEQNFDTTEEVEVYVDLQEYCKVNSPIISNCTILESNYENISGSINDTYVYLKLKCYGKSSVKLEGYRLKKYKYENKRIINETGNELKIDNDFVSTNMSTAPDYLQIKTDEIINYTLKNRPKYKINFDYNGDPRIEAGDFIEVKNKYNDNYDRVVITKINSTFKGSYHERVEGDIYEK